MQITAALVKELREMTGAGMMDCKKALQETAGDIEAAVKAMRQSGIAKAVKKAGRIAAEGAIVVKTNDSGSKAVLLEVNCETDFVAKDASFQGFCRQLGEAILAHAPADMEAMKDTLCDTGATVEQARLEMVLKLGENIHIRRFDAVKRPDAGALGVYLHGGRIGVVLALSVDNPALAKDLAMHIAATNPLCINEEDMPEAVLEQEREIQAAKARASGKPDDIVQKMVAGRMRKFLQENTLSGQGFVKDPDMKVADLLKENNAVVQRFLRYEVGEGIEKKADNFAAEVMQQAGMAGDDKQDDA